MLLAICFNDPRRNFSFRTIVRNMSVTKKNVSALRIEIEGKSANDNGKLKWIFYRGIFERNENDFRCRKIEGADSRDFYYE